MLLAIDLSGDLEVVVTERLLAVDAGETARMELLGLLGLKVRPFNTTVAVSAQRVVELMVVVLAVRIVVNNVKVGSRERRTAGLADETVLVVTTS